MMSRTRTIALATGMAAVLAVSTLKASIDFAAIDNKATLTSDTTVVVTGSMVCSATETLSITAVITQDHGQDSLAGQGTVDSIVCTGAPQSFAVPVTVLTPPNGSFKKGPASVILSGFTATGSITLVDRIQISR